MLVQKSCSFSVLTGKDKNQPRSQGLSSLPPLVVGRKTLVAAGHMTTQNLGGKKICWVGGVAEYFVWLMWQTLWASNPGFDKTLTPGQLTPYWPPTDPLTDPPTDPL